jgi:hypothetical protein
LAQRRTEQHTRTQNQQNRRTPATKLDNPKFLDVVCRRVTYGMAFNPSFFYIII